MTPDGRTRSANFLTMEACLDPQDRLLLLPKNVCFLPEKVEMKTEKHTKCVVEV